MEQTILGLNLWAWLGFLFLILAGICSAKAAKISTKQTIKKEVEIGVDNTLQGTQSQIDYATNKIIHPTQSLYDYMIKQHKPVVEALIDDMILSSTVNAVINARKQGVEVPMDDKRIGLEQLESSIQEINKRINNHYGQYIYLRQSLDILVSDANDQEIDSLFEIHKSYIENAKRIKDEFILGRADYSKCTEKFQQAKEQYSSFVIQVKKKREKLNLMQ